MVSSICRYDAASYTDADAQFDLRELAAAYPLLDAADLVAGWRRGRCDPWPRRFASAVSQPPGKPPWCWG